MKGHLRVMKSSHYLDYGDGFMIVYVSKLIKLHSLNICSFLHFNYTSVT